MSLMKQIVGVILFFYFKSFFCFPSRKIQLSICLFEICKHIIPHNSYQGKIITNWKTKLFFVKMRK